MVARDWILLAVAPGGGNLIALRKRRLDTSPTAAEMWIVPLAEGDRPARLGIEGGCAAYSPDGKRMAVSGDDKIYLAGADGSGLRQIGKVDGMVLAIAWHPAGRALRATVRRHDGDAVWHLDFGGGASVRTIDHATYGSWTADGSYFLSGSAYQQDELRVRRERDGKEYAIATGPLKFSAIVTGRERGRAYVICSRDQGEVVRYDERTKRFVLYGQGLSADGLAFSPDGGWMAYSSWPERVLWRSRADGSEGVALTGNAVQASSPRWSPDGKRIAFIQRKRPAGAWKIHVIPAQGGQAEDVMPGEANTANPCWSSDGRSLVFAGAAWMMAFVPGSSKIRRLDLATGKIEDIAGGRDLWSPKWSGDGKYLVAETLDSRSLTLYEFATGRWRSLGESSDLIGYVSWGKDSKSIHFNGAGPKPKVLRIDVESGRRELALPLDDLRLSESLGEWFGLGPADEMLFLRDTTRTDVYALELDLP